MSQPYSIVCVRMGDKEPAQSDVLNELRRVQYQYGDLHPLLRLDKVDCSIKVGAGSGFPDINKLIEATYAKDSAKGVSFVCLNLFTQLVTIITFPGISPHSIIPLDEQPGSHLAGLKNIITPHSLPVQKQLSLQDEIRHLLPGISRHRQGLFLAGSPGWNSVSNSRNGSQLTHSKNDASLSATLNDANAMFHLFHSLTEEDFLSGLVAGFLIQEKAKLLSMLQMLPVAPHSVGFSKIKPEHGLITFDTKLCGSVTNKGSAVFTGEGGIGFGETIGERLHNGSGCADKLGQFAVIYYSGHGSKEGNMQIEKQLAIEPEELFEISMATGIPYLIILDMCFSSHFAHRYCNLLRKSNWAGIVMCANDSYTSGGLSFESKIMGSIRRPYWSFNILPSNWSQGRGLYTTAFTLAIQQLREYENISGLNVNLSIEDFNRFMLRSICEKLATQYRVPLLKPTVFSHE